MTFMTLTRGALLGITMAALHAAAAGAACGKAPAGTLTAQRIATVEPTRTGPQLYEGPVWLDGALYFSDFGHEGTFPSRIRKLAADGTVSTVIEDSGSNGLAIDRQGRLLAATHKTKALSRYTLPGGVRSTVAASYNGAVFNSPNDIAVADDGTIYFTDPDYQIAAAPGGQPVTGIYRVGTDGKVTLVDGSRRNPNGIALSAAGDLLYVNASDGEVRTYAISAIGAGVPVQGRTFVKGIEGGDGMTLDCHGNLYVTEHGARRVRVFSPQGAPLATIGVDANVTNAAFGGSDGRTLYITGDRAIWSLPLDVTGMPY
jgi:gluconolactonase